MARTSARRALLGSPSFLRLWLAQVVSSLGDWIGMVAVISLAARVGGSSSDAAVGLVMSARMIPGIFLAPVGGVLVDRWDRKRVMVTCDIGRGAVMATLPFLDTVWQLFVASLVIYALNRFALKPHFEVPFLNEHLNDLLCIPFWLPIMLLVQRTLGLRPFDLGRCLKHGLA